MIRKGTKIILKALPGQEEETDIPARVILDEDPDGGVVVAVIPVEKGLPQIVVYVESAYVVICDDWRWQAQVDAFYFQAEGKTT